MPGSDASSEYVSDLQAYESFSAKTLKKIIEKRQRKGNQGILRNAEEVDSDGKCSIKVPRENFGNFKNQAEDCT